MPRRFPRRNHGFSRKPDTFGSSGFFVYSALLWSPGLFSDARQPGNIRLLVSGPCQAGSPSHGQNAPNSGAPRGPCAFSPPGKRHGNQRRGRNNRQDKRTGRGAQRPLKGGHSQTRPRKGVAHYQPRGLLPLRERLKLFLNVPGTPEHQPEQQRQHHPRRDALVGGGPTVHSHSMLQSHRVGHP